MDQRTPHPVDMFIELLEESWMDPIPEEVTPDMLENARGHILMACGMLQVYRSRDRKE